MRERRLRKLLALPFVIGLAACGGSSDGDSGSSTDPTCSPACDASACLVCDTTGAAPACVSMCGADLSCQDGQCVAPAAVVCDPACGACQSCDTTGASPLCVDYCGAGTVCNETNGACEPEVIAPSCDPACDACSTCDTSLATPVCVSSCSDAQYCDASGATGVCRTTRRIDHSSFSALAGPFTDGPSVTSQCLTCHNSLAADIVASAHWKWEGPTPAVDSQDAALVTTGKNTLINNFCIAVPSNEGRCTQCHAGYGYVSDAFDFSIANKNAIDCLVCHADPSSGYKKVAAPGGAVDPSVDLTVAAHSVGMPARKNCGACHFGAGGGDNVKKGDMGSALASPTRAIDVHMGSGMTCNDCHITSAHQIPGQGVHIPVNEGRVACSDCHTGTIHADAILESHTATLACQTCHVPAFSRTQPTKMNWLWETAGNKEQVVPQEDVTLVDGTVVQKPAYDWMKGTFHWEANVRPSYAWYDGNVQRMAIPDTYIGGNGASPADPVLIAKPTASAGTGKIFPFKVMTGNQPGDDAGQFLIVPKLFGADGDPDAFWKNVPATYDAAAVETVWDNALTAGARYALQIAQNEAYDNQDGAKRSWSWVYTAMYMGINHEVAPSTEALGCTDCHLGNAAFDFTALGYTCDPMTDGGVGACAPW